MPENVFLTERGERAKVDNKIELLSLLSSARCERTRARRPRAESLSHNVHPLCARCRTCGTIGIIDRVPTRIEQRSSVDSWLLFEDANI